MTKIRMSKLKLADGGDNIWRAWCQELEHRRDEAVATLIKESVKIEACFTDGEYIYILMVAESFDQADSSVKEDPHPIDLDHRENMMKSIVRPDHNPNLELLFFLEA